ncbi:hypothetical protein [Streptomyces lydicus]|uniref:hypothetical protein n=1 Tax=Streptomyces lydicus TaxID=47763 RepID=UPI000982517D|nr:hypothetical protein [Streptomyces lydicus]
MTAPTTAISPTADTTSRVRSVHRRRGAGDTEAEEPGAEEPDETEGPEEIRGSKEIEGFDETEGPEEIEESDETEAAEEGVGAGPGTGAGVSCARWGTPSGRYFPFTARYPPGLIR